MHPNAQLLHTFYTAFQQKDSKTMQACYADQATFHDEAFPHLNAGQVRAMWEMLCRNARDFHLEYRNVQAEDITGHAEWTATYTFSATGRKVVNVVRSEFTFEKGKIVQQRDRFDFPRWARQAFGLTGLLMGGTGFFQRKVQEKAMHNLHEFMSRRKDEAKPLA
ncbi:Ketosteroid isomerase-related protein [Catalinimonas alkaloidigena]|uniref:Ketosteroid isomerase-related protein n=1 Tax=Catalinimonas alkaloidigena TaxID=1075417 RepID=A0A1G8XMI7_9BACT|nr:nuclear transport factor 2 family protein [Catalinimonas alkaloidigena]SDJ91872.1 Ketosteroid isomerase-related protein [Catalinimonas alkaloidigena]